VAIVNSANERQEMILNLLLVFGVFMAAERTQAICQTPLPKFHFANCVGGAHLLRVSFSDRASAVRSYVRPAMSFFHTTAISGCFLLCLQ
jgi:hypothetical protein